MALGGQAKPQEVVPLAPVNLDTAEKHMDKIESALLTIKDRLAEIMKTCPLGALLALSLAPNISLAMRTFIAIYEQPHQDSAKACTLFRIRNRLDGHMAHKA